MELKRIVFALVVCLMMAAIPALAETYTCEQQGFTFEYDPAYTAQWEDGNGVVVYTDEPGYIPYAIAWCASKGDVSDFSVEDFFTRYTGGQRENRGDTLLSIEEGVSVEVNGEQVPGIRYIYDLQGYEVELSVFLHKTGDSIRQFTTKTLRDDRESSKRTMDALLTLMRSFALTDGAAAAPSPAVDSNLGTASAETALGFKMKPITWDGVGIGKMAVPDGYVSFSEVRCSDESTCMGSPLRINLTAMSENSPITMSYHATETYIDRVSTAYGFLTANEGELDSQTATFQKHYLNAAQYCDDQAAAMNATFWKEEPITFYDAMVNKHYQEYASVILPDFMTKEWCEVTAAHRVYTYEVDGKEWAMCIAAEVRGLQYSLTNARNEVLTVWDVPGGCFRLICPLEDYERIHSGAFAVFMQNTSATDKFFEIQETLSNQIRDQVISQMNMVTAQSMAYAAAMDSFMSESVNTYLASSSYDTAARFSDYMFDQNTYTTSDGYDISISTGYDYVWEGSNGNVYYSQYASDMPYGATQLSPR